MKNRSLSERENYLRALEFSRPEWIPVTWDLGSAWVKYGQDLEDVVLRHPLIFSDYQRGSYIGGPHDPFFRAYDSLRDDWGCVWRNPQAARPPGAVRLAGHPRRPGSRPAERPPGSGLHFHHAGRLLRPAAIPA